MNHNDDVDFDTTFQSTLVDLAGWTSRFQFEETWASLLGLLNPAESPEDAMLEVGFVLRCTETRTGRMGDGMADA